MSKSLQHWERQATLRQDIIIMERRRAARMEARLTRTIEELTASVVQLENDYDAVEAELHALTIKHAPHTETVELPTSDIW